MLPVISPLRFERSFSQAKMELRRRLTLSVFTRVCPSTGVLKAIIKCDGSDPCFFVRMGFKSLVKEGKKESAPKKQEHTSATEELVVTKKIKGTQKIKDLIWRQITSASELVRVLAEWKNADELLVYFHAAEGSLFAQQLQDVVLARAHEGLCFPDTLLQDIRVKKVLETVILSAMRRVSHDAKKQRRSLVQIGIVVDGGILIRCSRPTFACG